MNFVKINKIPLINQIPIWAYAIVVMFGVNYLIQKIGLGHLIDSKMKSRINETLSDYAITAAIASIPLEAIAKYMVPIVFMCILGFIVTAIAIILCCKKYFRDCWVERSVSIWGSATGVFLNGLMLLKIVDPDYKLTVLNDYSISFSLTSITGFIIMPMIVLALKTSDGMMIAFFSQVIIFIICMIGLIALSRRKERK